MTDEKEVIMETEQMGNVVVESAELRSEMLERTVHLDFYQAFREEAFTVSSLLLVNDGQDLLTMDFERILGALYSGNFNAPLLVVGIHSGESRKEEYGMSAGPDFRGRGARAGWYEQFVVTELIPFIRDRFPHISLWEAAFAGFSLGGLSALDIAWNHPDIFSKAGVFSGSLWWRSVDKLDKEYDPAVHRMMHAQIRGSNLRPGLKFFFECGEQDEWEDLNRNGVSDSIDDTIDLMRELVKKGYREGKDIRYLQLPDGRSDLVSWAKAFPAFLEWGWSERG